MFYTDSDLDTNIFGRLVNHLSVKILENLRRRFIKNYMDVIVLAELRNHPMSGYDVIRFIHRKFGVLVSSGTVYSLLYSLERNGLIKGVFTNGKRVYTLSQKSEQNIETILDVNNKVQSFLRTMLCTSYTRYKRPLGLCNFDFFHFFTPWNPG